MRRHPRSRRAGIRRARGGILVLGGGFGGATVARRLGRTGATLVSTENALLFTPMLPEMASGSLEPRHVVVPLRQMCPHADLTVAEVTGHDLEQRVVTVTNEVGELRISYEHLVVALGAVPRTLPIPGLAEHAVGFKTFADGIFLRNHILRELELADNELDTRRQEIHLSFVFVGAGYTGVEAIAELRDLVQDALRQYPNLGAVRQRWVLIEAQDRILSTIAPRLGEYAAKQLRAQGIELRTSTRIRRVTADDVQLDDGELIPTHTVVWSAGVAPKPVVGALGLPTDDQGRLIVDPTLRVEGHDNIWALGDAARVPNARTPGRIDPPTSQHAIRQGRRLARNLLAVRAGQAPQPYAYRTLGQVATLGRHKGIAEVLGVRISGFPGWFITRAYHLYALPLLTRKMRVVSDWTLALFFRRDVVAYGAVVHAPSLAGNRSASSAP